MQNSMHMIDQPWGISFEIYFKYSPSMTQFTLIRTKIVKYPNNQSIINKATDNGDVCNIIWCMDDPGIWATIALDHNSSMYV